MLEDGSFYSIDFISGEFMAVKVSPIIAIQMIIAGGNYGLLDEYGLVSLAIEVLEEQDKINRDTNETDSYIW